MSAVEHLSRTFQPHKMIIRNFQIGEKVSLLSAKIPNHERER